MTTITISKRTARNTCYTIVSDTRNVPAGKQVMLHARFENMLKNNPDYIVIDNAM